MLNILSLVKARLSCRGTKKPIFSAALLLALIVLSACSARQSADAPAAPGATPPQAGEQAGLIWQRYAALAGAADLRTGPFRINATLRYSNAAGKNERVSALFWGNGKAESPYPLRLDLLAGMGRVVAKVREDAASRIAYLPEENTVYIPDDGLRTLSSFGVPIPLSLGDLSLLLTGRSGALFLPPDAVLPEERSLTERGARYAVVEAKLPGILELSASGAPVFWKEAGATGWSMEMEPDPANPQRPARLRIFHAKGHTALIVVRDISRVSPPYSNAQMDFALPPDAVRRASLDEWKR